MKKKNIEGNSIRSRKELANQPHKLISLRTIETDTLPREETKSFANSQNDSNVIPEKKGTAAETDSVRSMDRVNMLPKIGVKDIKNDFDLQIGSKEAIDQLKKQNEENNNEKKKGRLRYASLTDLRPLIQHKPAKDDKSMEEL